MDTQMLIGAKFEAGTETDEKILNPKTGELIVDLPEASLAQVEAAVDAAEGAFVSWSQTTPGQRSALLLALADAIDANADELARLESQTCGKPYAYYPQDNCGITYAAMEMEGVNDKGEGAGSCQCCAADPADHIANLHQALQGRGDLVDLGGVAAQQPVSAGAGGVGREAWREVPHLSSP